MDVLREAARLRVRTIGLRPAAREIGLSWNSLRHFLESTRAHPATIQKLTAWYERLVESHEGELDPGLARTMLALLLQHITPSRRNQVEEAILELLRKEAKDAGEVPPPWVMALLAGEGHP